MVDGHRDGGRAKAVAGRLREEFARIGLSVSEVARRIGKTQQALSRRMTGHVPFDVEELDLICGTVGISYEYVTTGIRAVPSGPPEPPPSHPSDLPRRGGQLLRLTTPRADRDATVHEDALAYVQLAEGEEPAVTPHGEPRSTGSGGPAGALSDRAKNESPLSDSNRRALAYKASALPLS